VKVIEHEGSTKPEEMTLSYSPMVVWFTRTLELKVERGDTVKQIGQVIARYWDLKQGPAEEIAAFWFAIGERRAAKKKLGGWTDAELLATPSRRYLR
jgi:hypothetical protein